MTRILSQLIIVCFLVSGCASSDDAWLEEKPGLLPPLHAEGTIGLILAKENNETQNDKKKFVRSYKEDDILRLNIYLPEGGFKNADHPKHNAVASPQADRASYFRTTVPVLQEICIGLHPRGHSFGPYLLELKPSRGIYEYTVKDRWAKEGKSKLWSLYFVLGNRDIQLDIKISQAVSFNITDDYYFNKARLHLGPTPLVLNRSKSPGPLLLFPNKNIDGKRDRLFPELPKPNAADTGAFTGIKIGEAAFHSEGKVSSLDEHWYALTFIRGLTVAQLRLTVVDNRRLIKEQPKPQVWKQRLDHVGKNLDQYIQWNMWVDSNSKVK